jgi:hypothetical protein
LFNEGQLFQLYSPDFNYTQRFHTPPGVSWAELVPFVQAFFQWKSGRRDYQPFVLQEPLPAKAMAQLQAAAFWQPDNMRQTVYC